MVFPFGSLNRHPSDDGRVGVEVAAFGGFWQSQFFDTGTMTQGKIER
jgi:hypothetical protein